MFFSKNFIASTAIALLSITPSTLANDCDAGPFNKPGAVGDLSVGPSGDFCETKWKQGHTMTGIEVWAAKFQVHAIQFSWSDGTKGPVHGTIPDDVEPYGHDSLTWQPGQSISSMAMAQNKDHQDGLGRLKIEGPGKTIDVQSRKIKDDDGDNIPVSSGIIIGAYGNTGEWISNLGFMFLKQTVGKAEIIDVKFPETIEDLNAKQEGIESKSVDTLIIKNPNKEKQEYFFGGNQDKTWSKTLTQQWTNSFGVSVAVEVGGKVEVPLIAEAEVKVTTTASYEHSEMGSQATTESGTHTLRWQTGGDLAPNSAVSCTADSTTGHYSSDYESTVRFTLTDGETFDATMPGHFESIGYTDAVASCKNVPIDQIKDSDNVETAEESVKNKPKSSRLARFMM